MKRFPALLRTIKTAGRLLDTAVFSALILFFLYIADVHRGRSAVLFMLYVLLFVSVHLIRLRIRSTSIYGAERKRAERVALLNLMLKDDKEIIGGLDPEKTFVIRKLHPTEDDVIDAIRSSAETIFVAEIRPWMAEIRGLSGSKISFADMHKLLSRTGEESRARTFAANLFSSIRPNLKYCVLGCVLYVLSPIVRYKIYYRTVAFACLFLAGMIGVLRKMGRGKFFPEFLDKKGRR